MFSAIRKHLNPATVMAFAALIFAMTGGAFAATSHGGGTSSEATASAEHGGHFAVAAKAKAAPKGKVGPRGPAGKAGATGATGATGPAGAAGPAGAVGPGGLQGPVGATGATGATGEKGTAGANGTTGFTKTLPRGATETGTWAMHPAAEGEEPFAPLDFAIPLATELEAAQVHFMYKQPEGKETCKVQKATGETEEEENERKSCEAKDQKIERIEKEIEATQAFCPGNAEAPTAVEGNLCVYEGENFGGHVELLSARIFQPHDLSVGGAGTAGAILDGKAVGSPAVAFGAWAVTAE